MHALAAEVVRGPVAAQSHEADPHLVGGCLLAFGLLFAALGLFIVTRTVVQRLRWVPVSGRIVGLEASRVGDLPRVEYVDGEGVRRHFTSRFASNNDAALHVGTDVDLLVNPQDPTEGMISSGRLAGQRVALVVGGLFVVIGLFFAGLGLVFLNVAPEPQGW